MVPTLRMKSDTVMSRRSPSPSVRGDDQQLGQCTEQASATISPSHPGQVYCGGEFDARTSPGMQLGCQRPASRELGLRAVGSSVASPFLPGLPSLGAVRKPSPSQRWFLLGAWGSGAALMAKLMRCHGIKGSCGVVQGPSKF